MPQTPPLRRKRDEPMTPVSLASYCKRRLDLGKDSHSELTEVRTEITDRYFGKPYGTEREDQSQYVTREVMETVEWALPDLLRGFLGTGKAVVFEPTGPEDEELAEQETDVVNYKLLRANDGDGYSAFYDWFKEALLYPTAFLKINVEEKEESFVYEMKEVPQGKLLELLEDEAVELLEQESRMVEREIQDPQSGQMVKMPMEVFDIRYRETKQKYDLVLMPIPGEDVYVDKDLTSINLDKANFVAHRTRRNYTELVKMGYDKGMLDEVSPQEDSVWNEERTSRRFYEDEYPGGDTNAEDPSMVEYDVYECYLWVDYDGSGEAQFRRVVLVEDTVFENEEVAYQPLVALSTAPFPHKLNGLSLAQMVEPNQRLSTELHRQALNNLYRINTQRMYISEEMMLEGGLTKKALDNRRAGYIPVRGVPSEGIMPEPISPMVGEVLPVIQHVGQMNAVRSGVAPEQSMDQNNLQNTAYSSMMGALEASGARQESLARGFAETGMKRVFRKAHYLIRSCPDMAETVKLRGKWVDVDAASWKERTDVSVNIGLGFNSKQQMTIVATQLLEIVAQAAQQGLANPQGGYNALTEWAEAAGLKNPQMYFVDPNGPYYQPPEPPPDPNLISAQAQAQALQRESDRQDAELTHKIEIERMRARHEQQKLVFEGRKLEVDAQKAQADAAAKQAEVQMKQQQLTFDRQQQELDLEKLAHEAAKVPVDIDDTQAAAELKEAQTIKTLVEAGKAEAETAKVDAETSATIEAGAEAVSSENSDATNSGGTSE